MSLTTPLLQQDSDSGEEVTEDLHLTFRMESKSLFAVKKSVYALTFLSALGGFLFGYDTGNIIQAVATKNAHVTNTDKCNVLLIERGTR